jgi:hypothetical protein
MNTFRTPIINATVNYDPDLLKSNGIDLAATDNDMIYVDDLFQQMPLYVKVYLLLHEEGHIIGDHPYKRSLDQELEADSYAMKKMSKILVHRAMLHVIKVFMGIDWTIAAEFMVRLHDLGYSKAKEMYIIAPNGLRFDVDTIRKYI